MRGGQNSARSHASTVRPSSARKQTSRVLNATLSSASLTPPPSGRSNTRATIAHSQHGVLQEGVGGSDQPSPYTPRKSKAAKFHSNTTIGSSDGKVHWSNALKTAGFSDLAGVVAGNVGPGGLVEVAANAYRKAKDLKSSDNGTIQVCVRVRPFIKEELSGERSGGNCELCITMPTKTSVELKYHEEPRLFEFDRCFWSHSDDHPYYATQETLQEEIGESMLEHAMAGYNQCIFAYGQTGSGKSYSVIGGSGDQRGLLPRVVEGAFRNFSQFPEGDSAQNLVSLIEIYNENIVDLLEDNKDSKKHLEVRQHPVLGVFIPGLTEAPVRSAEDVMSLLDYGLEMRTVAATKMNSSSSRSHCIFTLKTTLKLTSQHIDTMSHMHLVDLAGSERSKRTKATGDTLKEGAAINQSLSTLARVISTLAKGGKSGVPPFRDSKLTHILKESLSGNSKTVMMAAISPTMIDAEETLSTLNFAKSAKQVQTKAVSNTTSQLNIEAQLRLELEQLKQQVSELSGGLSPEDQRESILQQLEEQEELCKLYGKGWDTLLAEEAARNERRMTNLNEARGQSMLLIEGIGGKLETNEALASSSSSSSSSDSDDDESATPHPARSLVAVLAEAVNPSLSNEARTSFVLPEDTELRLLGPIVQKYPCSQRLQDNSPELTKKLRKGRSTVRAVLKELTWRSGEAIPEIQLAVGLALTTTLPDLFANVLVKATVAVDKIGFADLKVPEDGQIVEWLTLKDLDRRLEWLKAERAAKDLREQTKEPLSRSAAIKAWLRATYETLVDGEVKAKLEAKQQIEDEKHLKALQASVNAAEESVHRAAEELESERMARALQQRVAQERKDREQLREKEKAEAKRAEDERDELERLEALIEGAKRRLQTSSQASTSMELQAAKEERLHQSKTSALATRIEQTKAAHASAKVILEETLSTLEKRGSLLSGRGVDLEEDDDDDVEATGPVSSGLARIFDQALSAISTTRGLLAQRSMVDDD